MLTEPVSPINKSGNRKALKYAVDFTNKPENKAAMNKLYDEEAFEQAIKDNAQYDTGWQKDRERLATFVSYYESCKQQHKHSSDIPTIRDKVQSNDIPTIRDKVQSNRGYLPGDYDNAMMLCGEPTKVCENLSKHSDIADIDESRKRFASKDFIGQEASVKFINDILS